MEVNWRALIICSASSDRIPMELALSSFFLLKPDLILRFQDPNKVLGSPAGCGQFLLPPASEVWWDQQKYCLISVAVPLLGRSWMALENAFENLFNFSPLLLCVVLWVFFCLEAKQGKRLCKVLSRPWFYTCQLQIKRRAGFRWICLILMLSQMRFVKASEKWTPQAYSWLEQVKAIPRISDTRFTSDFTLVLMNLSQGNAFSKTSYLTVM